jgi:hypothetical protein
MKSYLHIPVAVFLLLTGSTPSLAEDDIKYLLCSFKQGQIKVDVNYTAETVNGVPAIIADKESVWKPPGTQAGLAVINRYTGVMTMSLGGQQDTGVCARLVPKK